MLDHLTRPRNHPSPRTATGVAVSLALHAALIALVVYGVGAAATDGGTAGSDDAIPVVGTSAPGGIGGPIDISRYSIPTLDLRHAELTPRVAANLPDTLELGRAVPIRFLLPAERIASDSLLRVRTPAGAAVVVRLSDTRQASLNGSRFVVEPLTPEMQVTNRVRPTEWLWRVTPTEAGTQPLSLQLDAIASVDGFERVVTLALLPAEVVVRATSIQRASRFFSHHWTWLSLLTLVALAGWWRAALDRRTAG